jgi:hypothetical protein
MFAMFFDFINLVGFYWLKNERIKLMKPQISTLLKRGIFILIICVSTIMHFKHFSKDLMSVHVWRQTQTQTNIINFYEEDMNIFNPRRNERGNEDGIFRMEFPIMQWMVACLYKVFGNHLIISRIFMFVIGLLSTFGLYKLLYFLFNNITIASIGAWAITFSPGFFYYTINPLPDNFALCCSIWGLAFFFRWYQNKRDLSLILSGVFFALGALSKLPFIIFFSVPAFYFIDYYIKNGLRWSTLSKSAKNLAFAILPVTWYALVVPNWGGNVIIRGMLNNEESIKQILDYFMHHLISALPELHLNYASVPFFIAGFYFLFKNKAHKGLKFRLLLTLSISVLFYFVFEINAITKVHDYYLFPFYPLLFILVAYGGYYLLDANQRIIKYLAVVCLLVLPFTCHLRMQSRWDLDRAGFNKDLHVYKQELRDAVPKDALVVVGNDISHHIFFYYIDKKGWCFHDDDLKAEQLKTMIEQGAEYLYTDSEKLLSNNTILNMTDGLISENGSIRIYRLKSISQ